MPVNLVSIAATLGMLLWFFRKDLPRTYELDQLKAPEAAIRDKATFVAGYHRVWPLHMQNLEQYLRVYFTVATGPMTAGKVVMYINDAEEL